MPSFGVNEEEDTITKTSSQPAASPKGAASPQNPLSTSVMATESPSTTPRAVSSGRQTSSLNSVASSDRSHTALPSPSVGKNVDVDFLRSAGVDELKTYRDSIPNPLEILQLTEKDLNARVGIQPSEFTELCDEVLTALGDMEDNFEDTLEWKDSFLKAEGIPANIKLELALVLSRLFRRYIVTKPHAYFTANRTCMSPCLI